MKFPNALFALLLALVCSGCVTGTPSPATAPVQEITIYDEAITEPLLYRQFVIGEELPGNFALVLFLHGSGERGDDNELQLKHGFAELSAYCRTNKIKSVLLFPQCPKGEWWGKETNGVSPLDQILELLEAKKTEFKADRIYALGLSMGGFGTWELAVRHPGLLTAIIPICSGNDPANAAKLTKLPILVIHGTADKAVPVKFSRDMVKAIWNAGGDQVIYQEIPGCDHFSWVPAFQNNNTWQWLFAQ